MVSEFSRPSTVVGRRMRSRREELGRSKEKVGVLIGIDESSSRARISRYELGTHEPPVKTARQIAEALRAPFCYLKCEDDNVAAVLLGLSQLKPYSRRQPVLKMVEGDAARLTLFLA